MEVRVLHQHGWSISALARELGLSRNTVERELESPEPRRYPARAKPTALPSVRIWRSSSVLTSAVFCPAS
jgi:lambda repressor-like predicted transcriptional regulator